MKQLRLIASDFNTLTGKIDKQYTDNFDCPIFRAAKRRGLKPTLVMTYKIVTDNGPIFIKGNQDEVRRCQKALRRGAKYACIPITDEY